MIFSIFQVSFLNQISALKTHILTCIGYRRYIFRLDCRLSFDYQHYLFYTSSDLIFQERYIFESNIPYLLKRYYFHDQRFENKPSLNRYCSRG